MAFKDLFPEVTVLLDDFHSDTVNAVLQGVNKFLVKRAACNIALGETMQAAAHREQGRAARPHDHHCRLGGLPPRSRPARSGTRSPLPTASPTSSSSCTPGNIGLSQSLETLVEAAALLRDVPDLQVVFVGEGVKKAELQERARGPGPDQRHVPAVHAEGTPR